MGDLGRLKKIRAHSGLCHFWGLRVPGQHTKTTGRRGGTVGVSKTKCVSGPLLLIVYIPMGGKKNAKIDPSKSGASPGWCGVLLHLLGPAFQNPGPKRFLKTRSSLGCPACSEMGIIPPRLSPGADRELSLCLYNMETNLEAIAFLSTVSPPCERRWCL